MAKKRSDKGKTHKRTKKSKRRNYGGAVLDKIVTPIDY